MAYISFQPKDFFNAKLYTGTGSAQSISSVGFQPDWVWCKDRTNTYDHVLFDAVRGATKRIISNSTGAETTASTDLTSFDSDGFTVGSGSNINNSGNNFVSWNWKANGAGSANTDGSISSTVSANTTAGFSIVQYTGTSSNATVGHGLGVAPKMIILKSSTHAERWVVGHDGMDSSSPWNYFMHLEATDARAANTNRWQNTAPTNSVFSLGTEDQVNGAKTYIAYCFAEKKGFSKFGSYTGNGSTDGSFIFTGFKPAFVLAKRTNAVESWVMFDNKRDPHNVVGHILHPNNNTVESDQTSGTLYVMDFLSNGFKLKGTDTLVNGSGSTYIYMAFAEAPLVSSNGVPAVAR